MVEKIITKKDNKLGKISATLIKGLISLKHFL